MVNLFRKLFSNLKNKSSDVNNENSSIDAVKHFNNIIDFAKSVIDEAENQNISSQTHPVIDVIRLVGRKLQAEYMLNVISSNVRLPDIEPITLFFDEEEPISNDGKSLRDIKKKIKIDKKISLSRDLILPWPWERGRLIKCISRIGEGRSWGGWQQDSNHDVELWLPLGIAWVYGGNHSITTGIIQGSGEIKPKEVYDISDIYDYVYTDGKNYIRKHDESIISPVTNIEFAAIFEIGRIMKDKSISF